MERINKAVIKDMMDNLNLKPIPTEVVIDRDDLLQILQELKERREADNVADTSNIMSLDIKGQLRLIRDKCPDIYIRICNGPDCAGSVDLEVRKDCNYPTSDCQECWNKALEGEE